MNHEESRDINFASPAPLSDTPKGRNYLFAIAIDDYQHCTKLSNAAFDVKEFIELMIQRFQFEKENICLLVNEEATRKRVEQHFGYLARTLTNRDNLIVYFSGHGRWDEYLGGHWIPVEGGPSDNDFPDYISNDTVRGYLNRIDCLHTFLIADSCFSGSLFIDRSKEKFIGDRRETEPSRWGLTSGKREIVSDGIPGQHSPFATALLDVLKKADKPVSVMGLCHFVLEKVVANAQQTPMGSPLAIKGHQGGQFVFHFRADEEEDWEAVKLSEDPTALEAFILRHPAGKHLAEAKQRIAWLNDLKELSKANNKFALSRFIGRTNFNDLKEEAKALLFELEDNTAWQNALRRRRFTDFIDYLERFGDDGAHVEEAKQIIAELQREGEETLKAEQLRQQRLAEERERLTKEALESQSREREEAELKEFEERQHFEVVEHQRKEKEELEKQQQVQETPTTEEENPEEQTREKEKNSMRRWTYLLAGLSAATVVLVVLLIWKPWEQSTKENPGTLSGEPLDSTLVHPSDSAAFQLAKNKGTIPAWENFLKDFPESENSSDAKTALQNAQNKVAELLNDADVLSSIKPEAACQHLKEAFALDPLNTKVETIRKKLKKCTW